MNIAIIILLLANILLTIKYYNHMSEQSENLKSAIAENTEIAGKLVEAVNQEQAEFKTVVDKLQELIDSGSGATPEELQEMADSMNAANQTFKDAIADLASSVDPNA